MRAACSTSALCASSRTSREVKEWVAAWQGTVNGVLHVASTVAFAKHHVPPLLPEFLERYPELQLALGVTDRSVDRVAKGVDAAIRYTERLTDPSLVARRLALNRRVICAAPSYLQALGTPQTPDDLASHNCLRLCTVSACNDWEFEGPDGTRVVRVGGNFESNSADAIYHAALAGLGIARLSMHLIRPDLKAGRLVQLLPAHVHDEASIQGGVPAPPAPFAQGACLR